MNNYIDYHTRKRQLWIAAQSRDIRRTANILFGAKNQHGVGIDEFAFKVSDIAAAVILAVMIVGIFQYL